MWTSLIAILQAVLEIAKEWLTWQTALAKIQARKLAYDIDQEQIAKGAALQLKINAAQSAGDLTATKQLLDAAADEASFSLNIQSAIPNPPTGADDPDNTGAIRTAIAGDIRGSVGVPTSPGSTSSSSDVVKPAKSPVPVGPTIPLAPLSATGKATIFGRNYDDSDDTGDLNKDGSDSSGFFIDPATGTNYLTHSDDCIGASLPREVLLATLLGITSWRSTPILDVWRQHSAGVQGIVTAKKLVLTVHDFVTSKTADSIPLVDAGPSASTGALLDRTRGLCTLMGSKNDSHVAVWLHGPDGAPISLSGWLFDDEKIG